MRIVMTGLALALCMALPAAAANTLAVTGAAALEGSFGLEITRDGTTNAVYVQDNSPNAETTGRVVFRVDPNSMPLPNNTQEAIFIAAGPDPGGGSATFRVYLVRSNLGAYRVRAYCRIDDGPGIPNWARTNSCTLGDAARQVQVEWSTSTSPGANDGICRITRLDNGCSHEETGLDIDDRDWRRSRLGLVTSIDSGISGSFYLDDYQSFR